MSANSLRRMYVDNSLNLADHSPDVIVSILFAGAFCVVLGIWFLILLPRRCVYVAAQMKSWWTRWRGSTTDATEKRVLAQYRRKRQDRIVNILLPAVYPVVIFNIYSLSGVITGGLTWNSNWNLGSKVALNYEGLLVSFLCLVKLTFPDFTDKLIKGRVADAIIMALFLSVGSHTVITRGRSDTYVGALNQSITVQMILAMVLCDASKVGFVNVINLIMQIAVLYAPDPPPPEVRSQLGVGPGCYYLEDNMLYRVVWNAFFTQLASAMVSSVLMAEARASVGELEASRSEKTASDLLSVMCDAVVALRKDLTFREPSPRLLVLLLRQQVMSWAPDTSFLRYLAEDDQPRFQQLLGSSTGAGTFHVHLVDALGRKVPVQVFHTTWTDPDDNETFLLGVQEEKEVDAFPAAPDITVKRVQAPEDALAAEPPVPDDDGASSSSSNSSRSRSRSEFGSVSAWGQDPVYCLIKADTKLNIVHQSDQCRALFVFDKDQDLLSYIHEPSGTAVMHWLQHISLSKGKKKSHVEPFGHCVLRNAAGVEYKVHLEARYLQAKRGEDGEDRAHVSELELKLTPPALPTPLKTDQEILKDARRKGRENQRRLEARVADLPGVPDQAPSQPSIPDASMSL